MGQYTLYVNVKQVVCQTAQDDLKRIVILTQLDGYIRGFQN